jgi:hypothetical protein
MTKKSLSRRRFIQAMGLGAGASLVTPLLSRAFAEGDGTQIKPRRVVICLNGNGIERHTLTSDAARQAGSDDDAVVEVPQGLETAPALGALAGQNGELDLRPHAAVLMNLSSKITGGSHTSQYKALSCSNGRAQTVDSWLAQRLHTGQPFSALRLGSVESRHTALQYGMCLQSPGRQLPIIANPLQGHRTVFGSLASGEAGREFAGKEKLLDFALSDANRAINSFSGGSRERAKLENYTTALEEIQTLQEQLIDSEATLRSVANSEGIDPEDGSLLQSAHPLLRLEAQYRLATAALKGDLARTVVLSSSTGYTFSSTKYSSLKTTFEEDSDFDGTIPRRHGVCHGASESPSYQKVLDRVIERQVEMIARLARDLAAVPEGDGTMLDHTVIVFMSDNGSTHHSQAGNWPMLVVGGSKIGIETGGRTLIYPSYGKSNNRRVSNAFSSLGYVAGYRDDEAKFGGEPDKAQVGGPLTEILSS